MKELPISKSSIVEVSKDLIISPFDDHNSTPRTAYFLKPTETSIDTKPFEPPPISLVSKSTIFGPKKKPPEVRFNGWLNPLKNWKSWVDILRSKHQSTWEKAGIYEAIMGSTSFGIVKHNDLVLGLAEKWCPKTNTFIFSWGESTITLEDMAILGGYSVLGSPVFTPLETEESRGIEEKLIKSRSEFHKSRSRKPSHQAWMNHFMENESEIEHEAFLSLWLARFVFPGTSMSVIPKHVFQIAVHLSKGKRIALAPAILACIYRDLSFLKEKLVASSEVCTDGDGVSTIALGAPIQFVQVWAWERFLKLQPKPKYINFGEPMFVRWSKVKYSRVENIGLALDSAAESFQWRPYADFHKFYTEKGKWVSVFCDSDEEIESYGRCLRACELVGIDCTQQYSPHRVAMQFGYDQDIPGHFIRLNGNPRIAWESYDKPGKDVEFYVPSRQFKPGVTVRYLEWWKRSVLGKQDDFKIFEMRNGDNGQSHSPGVAPKVYCVESEDSNEEEEEDRLTLKEPRRSHDNKHKKAGHEHAQNELSSGAEDGVVSETELMMKSEENDVVKMDTQVVNESASRCLVHENDGMSKSEGKSDHNCALEVLGLNLEARISKLENVIAELKAARSATKVVNSRG